MNYRGLMDDVLDGGRPGPNDTLEVLGVTLLVSPDDQAVRPGFCQPLANEMARQMVEGTADIKRFKAVAPNHDASLWDGHPFEGARIDGGLAWEFLNRNAQLGRRAVWEFVQPYCWTALQAFDRDGTVSVVLFQRSCDIWRGLPYDLAMLQAVWRHLADGRPLGECHWFIGSLHLYERDFDAASSFCQGEP